MMFIDVSEYPEIARIAEKLVQDAPRLRSLAAHAATAFVAWPEPLHAGGWDVLALKWQGKVVPPWLSAFPWLAKYCVLNAGFSRLAPGTVIEPHYGYTDSVLRLHLGLNCPPGASITVGEETRQWRENEVLLFDDTQRHSARNDSDSERLILLVDIRKTGH